MRPHLCNIWLKAVGHLLRVPWSRGTVSSRGDCARHIYGTKTSGISCFIFRPDRCLLSDYPSSSAYLSRLFLYFVFSAKKWLKVSPSRFSIYDPSRVHVAFQKAAGSTAATTNAATQSIATHNGEFYFFPSCHDLLKE